MTGISTASQISAGSGSCALLSNGQAACWGGNVFGQLGDGTSTGPETCGEFHEPCSRTPVEVTESSIATQVSAGEFHNCALLSNGQAECWGINEDGQLGDRGWRDDLASSPLGAQW